MRSASNRTCPICGKRFGKYKKPERTLCVAAMSGKRKFMHKKCHKAVLNFRLSPEETALFESILDWDYLQQEHLAESTGITREQMLANISAIIKEFGSSPPTAESELI
jgi:hypothetical protein